MEARAPQSQEWKQIDNFLNETLRKDIKWSLKDEYPLAFEEKNLANIRIIEEQGNILSHAVLKPTIIKTHWHVFKVGFIGSVVTNESHRGQGLSQSVIQSCIQAAEQQDCDFAMLWTDLFDFYQKFGFEVAGSEIALQVNTNFKSSTKKDLRILDTAQVSPHDILKLYNRHNLKTLRTAIDIQKYLKIPNSEVFTGWNRLTNQLEAYCVLGKGADFHNYIHEWGGSVSALLSLVESIQEKKNESITLITPPQCENLIRQMEALGAQKQFGVLGMIKIINPTNFCKKIKKGARALGHDQFIFEFRDGTYYFGYGQDVYQTTADSDMVRLVFGPLKADQIHEFSNQTLEIFKELFPIPFWVWGWDSI
ncbi:MAG: GNAT family N-acetyltransferase [Bdellovibrionales bacterium]|nr:GNAT family N-acetyltransferase [Bdellovibrionales bacterium]